MLHHFIWQGTLSIDPQVPMKYHHWSSKGTVTSHSTIDSDVRYTSPTTNLSWLSQIKFSGADYKSSNIDEVSYYRPTVIQLTLGKVFE